MKKQTTRADLVAEYLELNPGGDTKGATKMELCFMIYAYRLDKQARERDPDNKYQVLYRR